MAAGLEEPHVGGVRVDDVQFLELDAIAANPRAELPRHHDVGGNRRGRTVQQEERIPEVRLQVRSHDEIRWLAVRQPNPANGGDRRTHHDGVAHALDGHRRQRHDDDQRANGQADHRHAVENARREGDHRRDRDDRGQNETPVAPEQEEGDAFEQARLRDNRHEERQAEDEEHRVGMDECVEPAERQEVGLRPPPPAVRRDFGMPGRTRQADKRRDDDEQHPVGERVLVDLVLERSEQEEPEDGRQDLTPPAASSGAAIRGRRPGARQPRPHSHPRTTTLVA